MITYYHAANVNKTNFSRYTDNMYASAYEGVKNELVGRTGSPAFSYPPSITFI
jgi:hypothetical protein